MEAMEKLKSGMRFSEVATQYSEDKARQGVCCSLSFECSVTNFSNIFVSRKVEMSSLWD
jgi:hypothetical protein